MTGALLVPVITPDAIAWLAAILAAAGGITLHAVHPPQDEALAEALLLAAVHP
ncbi:hypothetical protein AAFN86_01035 [Roseomonas sp. CAU 1739]|uniref:hypothetical protein n=1 Tax=Roseomonas sp. CAU 1739 TaxID=3140364 RepID=UPI00325AD8C2